MKNKNNIYFDSLAKTMDFANKGADFLYETLTDFNPDDISGKVRQMHLIEHNSDMETHDMLSKLAKEFLPPIEREDILDLAHVIDDILDSLEDVLQRIYMYNIKSIRQEAIDFSEIIVKSCKKLSEIMADFPEFRKNDERIQKNIIDVNALESDADKLYIDGVRRLFTKEQDPTVILAWKETFDKLEKCCDNCEDAANRIGSVIMKNS